MCFERARLSPTFRRFRDLHRTHQELVRQSQEARERLSESPAAISAHSPLEKSLEQRKKELATAEVDLGARWPNLWARPPSTPFWPVRSGNFRVAERLDLHRKIADLEIEKAVAHSAENAGMLQNVKAKAQQTVVFGKIKLAAMSEGLLETAIGKNLIHSNQEEARPVRSDQ